MRFQDRSSRDYQRRSRTRGEYRLPSEATNVFDQRPMFSDPNDEDSFDTKNEDNVGPESLLPITVPTDISRGSKSDIIRIIQEQISNLETGVTGPSGVTLTAGIGLTGGGDLTADRTFDLDIGTLFTVSLAAADSFAFNDASTGITRRITFTNLQTTINHDLLFGSVANEHINHTSVTLTAGLGLSGGGDISADRTFTLDLDELSAVTPVPANDSLSFVDASDSNTPKKATIAVLMDEVSVDLLGDVDTTTATASLNDVLKWNGTDWVPGTAGDTSEFSFSIDSFAGTETDSNQLIGLGTWVASGAMTFNSSYSNPCGGMTATVTMTGSGTNWAPLALTGTPPDGPTVTLALTAYPAAPGDTITFTLTQSCDGSTAVDTVQFNNTMRYGVNTNTQGNQTEANIEALTEVSGPTESRTQNINNISGTGSDHVTFSHAARLSSIAQVRVNTGLGFVTASFNATRTTVTPTVQTANITTITNSASYVEAFECITSTDTGVADGSNDFDMQSGSTAQNYIFWGELAVDSGADDAQVYTEVNVEGNIASGGQTASSSMSSRSMTVNATGSEYTYIAYPSRMGALTSIIIGGFESINDFWWDAGSGTELAITNDVGFTENYYVYVSKNPGFTDPTTMLVTI